MIVIVVRSGSLFALEKNLCLVSCSFHCCSTMFLFPWLHNHIVSRHALNFKEISYSFEIVYSLVLGNLCNIFFYSFRVVVLRINYQREVPRRCQSVPSGLSFCPTDLILAASSFKKCLSSFVPYIFELLVESLSRLGFRILLPST